MSVIISDKASLHRTTSAEESRTNLKNKKKCCIRVAADPPKSEDAVPCSLDGRVQLPTPAADRYTPVATPGMIAVAGKAPASALLGASDIRCDLLVCTERSCSSTSSQNCTQPESALARKNKPDVVSVTSTATYTVPQNLGTQPTAPTRWPKSRANTRRGTCRPQGTSNGNTKQKSAGNFLRSTQKKLKKKKASHKIATQDMLSYDRRHELVSRGGYRSGEDLLSVNMTEKNGHQNKEHAEHALHIQRLFDAVFKRNKNHTAISVNDNPRTINGICVDLNNDNNFSGGGESGVAPDRSRSNSRCSHRRHSDSSNTYRRCFTESDLDVTSCSPVVRKSCLLPPRQHSPHQLSPFSNRACILRSGFGVCRASSPELDIIIYNRRLEALRQTCSPARSILPIEQSVVRKKIEVRAATQTTSNKGISSSTIDDCQQPPKLEQNANPLATGKTKLKKESTDEPIFDKAHCDFRYMLQNINTKNLSRLSCDSRKHSGKAKQLRNESVQISHMSSSEGIKGRTIQPSELYIQSSSRPESSGHRKHRKNDSCQNISTACSKNAGVSLKLLTADAVSTPINRSDMTAKAIAEKIMGPLVLDTNIWSSTNVLSRIRKSRLRSPGCGTGLRRRQQLDFRYPRPLSAKEFALRLRVAPTSSFGPVSSDATDRNTVHLPTLAQVNDAAEGLSPPPEQCRSFSATPKRNSSRAPSPLASLMSSPRSKCLGDDPQHKDEQMEAQKHQKSVAKEKFDIPSDKEHDVGMDWGLCREGLRWRLQDKQFQQKQRQRIQTRRRQQKEREKMWRPLSGYSRRGCASFNEYNTQDTINIDAGRKCGNIMMHQVVDYDKYISDFNAELQLKETITIHKQQPVGDNEHACTHLGSQRSMPRTPRRILASLVAKKREKIEQKQQETPTEQQRSAHSRYSRHQATAIDDYIVGVQHGRTHSPGSKDVTKSDIESRDRKNSTGVRMTDANLSMSDDEKVRHDECEAIEFVEEVIGSPDREESNAKEEGTQNIAKNNRSRGCFNKLPLLMEALEEYISYRRYQKQQKTHANESVSRRRTERRFDVVNEIKDGTTTKDTENEDDDADVQLLCEIRGIIRNEDEYRQTLAKRNARLQRRLEQQRQRQKKMKDLHASDGTDAVSSSSSGSPQTFSFSFDYRTEKRSTAKALKLPNLLLSAFSGSKITSPHSESKLIPSARSFMETLVLDNETEHNEAPEVIRFGVDDELEALMIDNVRETDYGKGRESLTQSHVSTYEADEMTENLAVEDQNPATERVVHPTELKDMRTPAHDVAQSDVSLAEKAKDGTEATPRQNTDSEGVIVAVEASRKHELYKRLKMRKWATRFHRMIELESEHEISTKQENVAELLEKNENKELTQKYFSNESQQEQDLYHLSSLSSDDYDRSL